MTMLCCVQCVSCGNDKAAARYGGVIVTYRYQRDVAAALCERKHHWHACDVAWRLLLCGLLYWPNVLYNLRDVWRIGGVTSGEEICPHACLLQCGYCGVCGGRVKRYSHLVVS